MKKLLYGSVKLYGSEVFGYTTEENWKKNKNLNSEEVLEEEDFDLINDFFSPICDESYGDYLYVRMLPGKLNDSDNIEYNKEISDYLKKTLENDRILYAFTRMEDDKVLVEFVTKSFWDKEKHLDGEYDKFLYGILEDNLCKFDMGFDAENAFFLLGEASRTDQEIKSHIESFFEGLVYSSELQKFVEIS